MLALRRTNTLGRLGGTMGSARSMASAGVMPRQIRVAPELEAFVEQRVLPGTGVSAERFWSGLDSIVATLGPRNEALLRHRDALQGQIDGFHDATRPPSAKEQEAFLRRIGYLQPAAEPYRIETAGVDAEIATVAGPQLVCPVENTRFILNAANARWGSLLDALYGTDAVLGAPAAGGYDARRGAGVWEETHRLLDELFPLSGGRWREVTRLGVGDGGKLKIVLGADNYGARSATNGVGAVALSDGSQFVGHAADKEGNLKLLLRRNGLHCELVVDGRPKEQRAARATAAGLVDVRLESAISTICDFEDSACTVDADDKIKAYDNWLGLMRRDLSVGMAGKDGQPMTRALNAPKQYTAADGSGSFALPSQALLLARNVGMHMPTDIVTTADGAPVPEHFLDALVTVACAIHDVRPGIGRVKPNAVTPRNSRHGSVYIVKPKMHGPDEVALACELFDTVEDILGLPQNTVKLGVMDEERRTSLNLGRAMEVAKERLVFVNTGFLDRTADEIHTSMRAGAVAPKAAMKGGANSAWLQSYEKHNVAAALAHGLVGKGQIGKGMWAEPDNMAGMLATKGSQLDAGASTAWVPSPTAATLHALHYLRTSVADVQSELAAAEKSADYKRYHRDILTAPVMTPKQRSELTADEVAAELDNNVQSLLGYVTRWVGQGVGCSKVPTMEGVQLMEDRATLRISSQLLANWLHHGVVSDGDVLQSLYRIAPLVDEQNAGDPTYVNLAPHFDGPEWHAALELVWGGLTAPNGYTEPTLTKFRRERKAIDAGGATATARVAAALAADELRTLRNELERKGARLDLELAAAARDDAAAEAGPVLEPGPVVGAAWSKVFVDADAAKGAAGPPPPRSRRDRLDSISVAP